MRLNRIAIMGTGSLGTILGAYITKGGRDIDLIDVNEAHVNALNQNGATVTGTVDLNVPVHAITPDQMEGEYDLFLYLAKQTYNDIAIGQMASHLKPDGIICTLQNGIPEPAIAEVIGEERTLGCTVGWGATWLRPGVSEATTLQERWFFHLGSIDGSITEDVMEVKSILELMCRTEVDDNLMGARWCKLLANAAISGMSAVLGCTFGEILDNDKALKCANYLGRECIRVTIAQGYKPLVSELTGKRYDEMFDFRSEEERKEKVIPIFLKIWGYHRASTASMLQDLQKGKKCEVEAINGVLSKTGRKVGVPTPVSDQVVIIIKEIENGLRKPSFDNLALFEKFES